MEEEPVSSATEEGAGAGAPSSTACRITFVDDQGNPEDHTKSFANGTKAEPFVLTLARAGDLSLCPGHFYARIDVQGEKATRVEILGAGSEHTVLEADAGHAVIAASDATLRVEAVSLVGGRHGVDATCSDVAVFDAALTGNRAGSDGGGGILMLSTNGCRAGLYGDGLVLEDNIGDFGGAISTLGAPVELVQSVVRHNEARFSGGGINAFEAEVRVDGVLFEGNRSPVGPAMMMVHPTARHSVSASEFLRHTADARSGAIHFGTAGASTLALEPPLRFEDNTPGDLRRGEGAPERLGEVTEPLTCSRLACVPELEARSTR